MTFGVVLFTLLVQSMTMKPLLRRLGISTRNPIQIEYETRHGRMVAFHPAALHLDKMPTRWRSLAADLGGSASPPRGTR